MRTFEDCRKRRGEPVLVEVCGRSVPGTIEWGDEYRGYSVATEPGGARFVVAAGLVRPDPGGLRPLWEKRFGRRE